MAGNLDLLLRAADKEWTHWGRSTWNVASHQKSVGHTDDEDKYAQYVIDNYCSIVKETPSLAEVENDIYFWSAVRMSAFFAGGNFSSSQFPFSNSHSTWIRKFVAARKSNKPASEYYGYRLTEPEAKPDVGDLIGYTYDKVSLEKAQKYFDKTTRFSSHTDLVVEKRNSEIDVIGANVLGHVIA